jgi:hypothetical protein
LILRCIRIHYKKCIKINFKMLKYLKKSHVDPHSMFEHKFLEKICGICKKIKKMFRE